MLEPASPLPEPADPAPGRANPVPEPGARTRILGAMQDGVNSPVANDAAADAAGEGHERAQAELIDSVLDGQGGAPSADGEQGEQITSPTKLIRIATMVRTMLDEVRRAPLDEAGRRMLKEIHEKSLHELEDVLSPDLSQELSEVVFPFTSEEATDAGQSEETGH